LLNPCRVERKVHHTAIANLSQCSDEEIETIKVALKHKGNLERVINAQERVKVGQKLPVGAGENIKELASICSVGEVSTDMPLLYQIIPKLRELCKALLAKTCISKANITPCRNVNVDTRIKSISDKKIKKIQVLNPKK
jgi:hypothetical protein